jgi:aminoglycoside/choline kinase family phosphotransferase
MTIDTDTRLEQLKQWIDTDLNWQPITITVASADASFRRYFRIHYQDKTYIAMDAPPEKEDILPFIDITQRLRQTGVHAPQIIAQSTPLGFLILEDLGSIPYQDKLINIEAANTLYSDALTALLKIQKADTSGLPHYDQKRLQEEMQLMPEWFLKTHLNIHLSEQQQQTIQTCFDSLCKEILQQPNGFVHRDYHCRNLMVIESNNPAIIDYQDAVYGPLTYDVVSLLRDCYIAWSNQQVETWALNYRDQAVTAGLLQPVNDTTFIRWFDFMGLQRHIKVLGIFCRLWHRDGKQHYLDDLPLTLAYSINIAKKYPETQALAELLQMYDIPNQIGKVDISV